MPFRTEDGIANCISHQRERMAKAEREGEDGASSSRARPPCLWSSEATPSHPR